MDLRKASITKPGSAQEQEQAEPQMDAQERISV